MYKIIFAALLVMSSIGGVSAYDYDTRIEQVDIVMSNGIDLDFPLLDDNTSLPLKYLLSNNSLFKISGNNFVGSDREGTLSIIIDDTTYINTYTDPDNTEKVIYFPTNQIRNLLVESDADLIRFQFCPYSEEFGEGNCSKSQRYIIDKLDEPYSDEYVKYQYYLDDSKIVEAKKLVQNNYRPVIAVIDNGVNIGHSDLEGKTWINENEVPGNGIDDDNNRYIDDYYGWNFVDNNSDISVKGSHGTSVALIIAATTDNDIGITGVVNDATIMSLTTCDGIGCSISDVEKAIEYAVDNGANIINISLGGESFGNNISLTDAIKKATEKGVVIVVATGNGDASLEGKGVDTSIVKIAPVCNETEKNTIIGVSALSIFSDRIKNGLQTYWTNYGECADIFAYGENIVITTTTGEYVVGEGTSFSAPIVAGIIGLGYSEYGPVDTNAIYDVLQESKSTWYGIDAKKYIENLEKAVRAIERERALTLQNQETEELEEDIPEARLEESEEEMPLQEDESGSGATGVPESGNEYLERYRESASPRIEELQTPMILRIIKAVAILKDRSNEADYIMRLEAIEILLNESLNSRL